MRTPSTGETLEILPDGDWRIPFVAFASGTLFLLPFLVPYHWLPVPSIYSNLFALGLAALMCLLLAFAHVRARRTTLQAPPVVWVPVALIALLLLQHFLGMHAYLWATIAPIYTLIVVAGSVCSGWAITASNSNLTYRAVAYALVIGGVAQCLWGLVQISGYDLVGLEWVSLDASVGPLRFGGLLQQPNMMAAYLCWGLVALVYLRCRNVLHSFVALSLSAVFMVAISLTGSRSSYAYFFIIAPALALALRHVGQRVWKWVIFSPLIFLFMDVSTRVIANSIISAGHRGLRGAELSNLGIRLSLFRDAVSIFLSAPLIGSGWNSFAGARFSLPNGSGIEFNADHAHNVLGQLLAESGLVGALIASVGVWLWLRRVANQSLTPERVFALSLLAVIGLYSVVEFPLWVPFFLLPTAFLIGALDNSPIALPATLSMTRLRAAAWVVMLVVPFAVLADYVRVERNYKGFFGVADFPPAEPRDLLHLSSTSLFRLEAEQLYLRQASYDSFLLPIELDIARRVFFATPSIEYFSAYCNRLILSGNFEEAVRLLSRYCERDSMACQMLGGEIDRLSRRVGGPFLEFATQYRGKFIIDP